MKPKYYVDAMSNQKQKKFMEEYSKPYSYDDLYEFVCNHFSACESKEYLKEVIVCEHLLQTQCYHL